MKDAAVPPAPNDAFSRRLIQEIGAGKFSRVCPSWAEIRSTLRDEFPLLDIPKSPEYREYRSLAESITRTISMPVGEFERITRGEDLPAQVGPAQALWVNRVLALHTGNTVGSVSLVLGSFIDSIVITPASVEIVRELLVRNFGDFDIPAQVTDPTIPLFASIHKIWNDAEKLRTPKADPLLVRQQLESRVQDQAVNVLLGMKRSRADDQSQAAPSKSRPNDS
jgi:hypothetical protein